MRDKSSAAFIDLFKAAYQKCFGFELKEAMAETESKHFSNAILDKTGLVIGAKSLKNYSIYVISAGNAKDENPSTATLDTLARYVAEAPYTDESERKQKSAHFPFWFEFLQSKSGSTSAIIEKGTEVYDTSKWVRYLVIAFAIGTSIALVFANRNVRDKTAAPFNESFHAVAADTLSEHGWSVQFKNDEWWNKRNTNQEQLTLFTLPGDSWTDSSHKPGIQNLVYRNIDEECFSTEIHFENFIPLAKWQQAGILLMEDTIFKGKSLRLSIAFNDFFGGIKRPAEIIVQGLFSTGTNASHPEEFLHYPLFAVDSAENLIFKNNLKKSALKIEKTGVQFRFLYASSVVDNFAFKEIAVKDLGFRPKYIGIFALRGFVDGETKAVNVKFFSLTTCDDQQKN